MLLLQILLLVAATVHARRVIRATPESNKTGCYIVKLEDDTSHDRFEELTGVITEESMDHHIYEKVEGNVSKIITAKLSEDALHRIKLLDNVEFLEQETYATGMESIPWHKDRIDQRATLLDGQYNPQCGGQGVDIYILDSGIRYDHELFDGRALYPGYDPIDNATGSTRQGEDCHGHGTHVASLTVSTYGVAQRAKAYSVRVLDCTNMAPWSYIIDGISYAVQHANKSGRSSVISMSIGGPFSVAVNAAVKNAVSAGIPVVVAAGNSNADACLNSPSGAPEAITVGGMAEEDYMYFYSNGGSCVDIFAPGSNIIGASYMCSYARCTLYRSGTSMAAPLVSGVVATLLGRNPSLTPAAVKDTLVTTSTKNALNLKRLPDAIEAVTPNRILYIADCDEGVTITSTTTVTVEQPITRTIVDTITSTTTHNITMTQTLVVTETTSIHVSVTETIVSTKVKSCSNAFVPTTISVIPTPTSEGGAVGAACCPNFDRFKKDMLENIQIIVSKEIQHVTNFVDGHNSSREMANESKTTNNLKNGLHKDSPAGSCSELLGYAGYSSDHYYIASASGTGVLMYCELDKDIRGNRGLVRVADLDMTNTTQDCPGELQLLSTPRRTCQRGTTQVGCSSAIFETHGIPYTKVLGRIRAYQYSKPGAFYPFNENPSLELTDVYVDGVLLMNQDSTQHYQHIWTFAAAVDESNQQTIQACPCTSSHLVNQSTIVIPKFVGGDYFCETGARSVSEHGVFYTDDPLWDGAGCGRNDVCCEQGEYFVQTLSRPSTSDIELRLCASDRRTEKDTPIDIIELYVQ